MLELFAFVVQATETAADAPAAPPSLDLWTLIGGSGAVVMGVLLLLVAMSITCWAVIGFKVMRLRRAAKASQVFADAFWNAPRLDAVYERLDALEPSPVGEVFRSAYQELVRMRRERESTQREGAAAAQATRGTEDDLEGIERAIRKAHTTQLAELEAYTSVLATTASAAPFIGLFGTVWGIMAAFLNIGAKGNASLVTVAPGIAEALVATATGLFAAIPAVVAYNYLVGAIRMLDIEMENFGRDFLNLVKRQFFR